MHLLYHPEFEQNRPYCWEKCWLNGRYIKIREQPIFPGTINTHTTFPISPTRCWYSCFGPEHCSTKPNNVPANRATDTGEFKKQSLKSDILFSPVQSGVLPESSSQRGSETYVGCRYIRVVDGDVDDKDDDGNFSFPLWWLWCWQNALALVQSAFFQSGALKINMIIICSVWQRKKMPSLCCLHRGYISFLTEPLQHSRAW